LFFLIEADVNKTDQLKHYWSLEVDLFSDLQKKPSPIRSTTTGRCCWDLTIRRTKLLISGQE